MYSVRNFCFLPKRDFSVKHLATSRVPAPGTHRKCTSPCPSDSTTPQHRAMSFAAPVHTDSGSESRISRVCSMRLQTLPMPTSLDQTVTPARQPCSFFNSSFAPASVFADSNVWQVGQASSCFGSPVKVPLSSLLVRRGLFQLRQQTPAERRLNPEERSPHWKRVPKPLSLRRGARYNVPGARKGRNL